MKRKLSVAGLLLFFMAMTGWAATGAEAVAVLDFSIPTASSNRWDWAAGGIPDLLQLELQPSGFNLLDRDLIHAVISEQRLAAAGRISKDPFQLAKLLNAQFLISGQIVSLAGKRFRVEANAFSVEAVETAVTVFADGDFPDDLSIVIKSVAQQLIKKLRAADAPAVSPPGNHSVPKPESLILFYRGLNACTGGQPERGAACFINAAALDNSFSAPLLWEIRAYEMAGLNQHAALRRQETSEVLKALGVEMAEANNLAGHNLKPVLAVLNPVVTGMDRNFQPSVLGAALSQALLATGRVRLFAFENIGEAVAEQDLRLSSFFTSQSAPRYGRWLAADGLVICRAKLADAGRLRLDLALVNPMTGATMTRLQRTGEINAWAELARDASAELLAQWTNHAVVVPPTPAANESSAVTTEADAFELRTVFQNLVNAMKLVRREGETSDSHRALADAFAAAGRPTLAALEIERCLELLDIHAPGADNIFLHTHRWLFWEPSPASGAAGLVSRLAVDRLIGLLLTNYPASLSAACLRYNLAVTAWREKNWPETMEQARQSREIFQALLKGYDANANPPANRGEAERELTAATYFLEGVGLRETGERRSATGVFHAGLDFMQLAKARNFCLPYGPYLGNFFGPERIYGCGGDPPGIRTRIEQELVKLEGSPIHPRGNELKPETTPLVAAVAEPGSGSAWLKQGEDEYQREHYRQALECYQQAIAKKISPAQCPGLNDALVELALGCSLSHPADEAAKLRRELNLLPGEVSWVEWFGTGRKYQTSPRPNWQKAEASYRSVIQFMENPGQGGFYHLEKEPCCERFNLRWGSSLGEVDLLWTANYAGRWFSAAFYLAQCLIALDRKEEAAEWLRRIALKGGGDNFNLLSQANWNSANYQDIPLGVRAAQMLKELHEKSASDIKNGGILRKPANLD